MSDDSKSSGHELEGDQQPKEEEQSKPVKADADEAKPADKRPTSKASASDAQKPSRKAVKTRRPAKKAQPTKSSKAGLFAAAALVIGLIAGWFARDAQAKVLNRRAEAAAAAGEGPCDEWEKKVCEVTGAQSAACTQTKGIAQLLPVAACREALQDLPGTLKKVKAARADCDKLVKKLCTDLGQETQSCKMVTERTDSFPPERCKEMIGHYDQVLGQLRAMEQRGGLGGPRARPGAHGSPHGPHAARPAPGAAPPVVQKNQPKSSSEPKPTPGQ